MFEISYIRLLIFITFVWVLSRTIIGIKKHQLNWKYEVKLLTLYMCLIVIARIVYFPMRLVDGHIASLVLDVEKIFPMWINLIPFVHLFDVYDGWLINIFGNIAMFILVGLALPFCFEKCDSTIKILTLGMIFPLIIEITQLLFYDRCSDIDDFILNTTGMLIGAFVYFSIQRLKSRKKFV